MDPSIAALATSVPNLFIAIWVIINYQKTIAMLLDNQAKLVNQLMALHPPQDPEKN